jgi:hypothetical protein
MARDGLGLGDIPKPDVKGPSQEQLHVMLGIAQELQDLLDHPGWKHMEEIAARLCVLDEVTAFTEAEAVKLASQRVYASGIRRLLMVPHQQAKKIEDLRKQLAAQVCNADAEAESP